MMDVDADTDDEMEVETLTSTEAPDPEPAPALRRIDIAIESSCYILCLLVLAVIIDIAL